MRWLPLLYICMLIACADQPAETSSYCVKSIDSALVADPHFDAMIQPFRDSLETLMSEVLVESVIPITKANPEGLLGNLVADLSFTIGSELAADSAFTKPDFCLLNKGGLRIELPDGPIDLRKAYELMPFENELVLVTVAPERMDSVWQYLALVNGQPMSNANCILNDSAAIEVKIGNKPWDPQKSYHIITTDYLADGGDRMSFFLNPIERKDLGIKLRNAIILHFRKVDKAGLKLNPKLDGRISRK